MKTRKFLAVLAAAAMSAALFAGFGGRNVAAAEDEVTVESLMTTHLEELGTVESASYEMVMDLDMSMSLFGFSQVMDMEIDVNIQTFGDNAYATGSMSNRSIQDGEETLDEQEVEQYIMQDGEEYAVYSYNKEADLWTKWTTEKPSFSLDMIPKFDTSTFTLEEEDDQYVVSGSIDIMDAIAALPDMFSGLTTSFGDLSAYSGETLVKYIFDKETKELKSISVDMAKAMQDIMDQSMAEAIAAFGEISDSSAEVDMSTLFSADFNSFVIEIKDLVLNQGSEIILPEEAKNAVESTGAEEFGFEEDDEEAIAG